MISHPPPPKKANRFSTSFCLPSHLCGFGQSTLMEHNSELLQTIMFASLGYNCYQYLREKEIANWGYIHCKTKAIAMKFLTTESNFVVLLLPTIIIHPSLLEFCNDNKIVALIDVERRNINEIHFFSEKIDSCLRYILVDFYRRYSHIHRY